MAQGSFEGAIISSVGLAKGTSDFFETSEKEVVYGDVEIGPMEFVDDVSRLAYDPSSAQEGNDRLETLAETKLLDFNLTKCFVILLGESKARKRLLKEFENKIPTLYGKKVNITDHETYLGDEIGFDASTSVCLTIRKRTGLVKKSIYEIVSLVEDFRSKVNGGILTGLQLWNSCVLPYLLNNSSTWMNIKEQEVNSLV